MLRIYKTRFIGADFSGADLKKSNFKGAMIKGAKFINSDLRGVTGLNIEAIGLDSFCGAILPDGTIQPPCSMGRIQVNNL